MDQSNQRLNYADILQDIFSAPVFPQPLTRSWVETGRTDTPTP